MITRKTMISIGAVSVIALIVYGAYSIGMERGMTMTASSLNKNSTAAQSAQSTPAAERKVLYWHDPMSPGQKFDKPGKSPFMDMQLVPVYADDSGDDSKVSISARVQQNLGIRTATVNKTSFATQVEAVGTLAYDERDVALVQARSNGYVEKLYVRATLDPVRKGQALADVYVPDWVAAQEEYLTIKRMAATGSDELRDAARQRMRLVGMSDEQIRLVDASGKAHARLTITAPISGVVTELGAREGLTIQMGAPLFRINGLSTIWVNAEVPENLAAQLRTGAAVVARSPALSGVVFNGKIGALLADINPTTRTLKARIELANPGGKLVPGMFVTVNLGGAARPDVLSVPSEAVIQTGTRNVVIVTQGDGKFAPVDVEIGAEANGRTEIRKGLEDGQKVVVSGQFLIDSEASLRGSATRMTPDSQSQSTSASKPGATK